MKKLISVISFVFILFALTTSRCSKDEVNLLIGTWNVNYFSQVTYVNGVKEEETIDLFEPGDMVIKIFDGGTGEEWENGVLNDEFTWVLDGDVITVTLTEQEMVIDYTYIVTDKNLLLVADMTVTINRIVQTIIADRATD